MMNTITLNNNIQMPMLGFGTFLMGGAECEESVLTALRSGYRMIDTAGPMGMKKQLETQPKKAAFPVRNCFSSQK